MSGKNRPLKEGRDYYMENGLFVLTEYFLRERGYCCGSGCRHCPYSRKKANPVEEVKHNKEKRQPGNG